MFWQINSTCNLSTICLDEVTVDSLSSTVCCSLIKYLLTGSISPIISLKLFFKRKSLICLTSYDFANQLSRIISARYRNRYFYFHSSPPWLCVFRCFLRLFLYFHFSLTGIHYFLSLFLGLDYSSILF